MSLKSQLADNTRYLECNPTFVIRNEQDILELISLCGENETNQILIYESSFSANFFDLKTKLAGTLFQKLANYHLRGAGLISLKQLKSERFKELIFECNQGNLFRFFEDKVIAEKWLAHK